MAVVVEAGSRLHAGFYHAGQDWGVAWGGAGFYVEEPRVVVRAWGCGEERVEAPREALDAVEAAARAAGAGGVCVRLESSPPRHSGLGSTTQIMLATYTAIEALRGGRPDPLEAASRLGRGRVSGVGVLGFALGGFVADAGGARLLMRHEIPGGWRFVVLIPGLPRGLSEGEEGFLEKPWTPRDWESASMARGFLRLASGVARGDLEDALQGLREMQAATGSYFSRRQGGIYRGDLSWIVDEASRSGIVLAQSSWGPALYTISPSDEARGDASILRSILADRGLEGRVIVSRPRNEGARVFV